jgi:hypothetical protein
MKYLMLAGVLALSTGCAWTSNFEAKTLKGAECKQNCAEQGTFCRGSSYCCDKDRSYFYSSF